MIHPFSAGWRFKDIGFSAGFVPAGELSGELPVDLPHSMVELPLNNFDEHCLETRGVYRKRFDTPEVPEGGHVFIDFEAVAVSCELWLNGRPIGRHDGPYTQFSFEITRELADKGSNLLELLVDSRENPDIPPFGGVVDYLVYGGIYRAVWLRVQDRLWIESWHARPAVRAFLEGNRRCQAGLSVDLTIGGELARGAVLEASLYRHARSGTDEELPVARTRAAVEAQRFTIDFPPLEDVQVWDVDNPALYTLELSIVADGRSFDSASGRLGFRTARFTPGGFFLNGRRLFLRGLNRHQSWPYVGYAMGPGPQRRDAEILAGELGVVMARTSHYPQSRHFLDACDELGLLVFTEMPGWQYLGGEVWKQNALKDLEALLLRDWNHPSIVLWGVRVNESQDDHAFYEATNALVAKLDPDRQRGGVRYLRKSEFLEDVYTFNDFSHEGGRKAIAAPRQVTGSAQAQPYLITEHNGHMYPTKRFDQEERLSEHARRHAQVLDAAMGDTSISGALGWCAFDYNTHRDFGSGDRICYHGVSDIFRIPKYAAALYASQADPSRGPVLVPAGRFAKGERSAARMLPIEVFTNCDAVDLYRAGRKVGRFFPDRKAYPHLPHPPVLIDDFIGDRIDAEGFSAADKAVFLHIAAKAMTLGVGAFSLADKLRFGLFLLRHRMSFSGAEALVIKYGLAWGSKDEEIELVGLLDGREALRKRFGADARAERLALAADQEVLSFIPGDEWNAARVLVSLEDQRGNPSPFSFLPVNVSVEGCGRLLGPSSFSLVSGEAAFWIATTGAEGPIAVQVSVPGFPAGTLALRAERSHG